MWYGRNSYTHDVITECPGYVGLRIARLERPIVQEDSIREYPIYKILKFAEETER